MQLRSKRYNIRPLIRGPILLHTNYGPKQYTCNRQQHLSAGRKTYHATRNCLFCRSLVVADHLQSSSAHDRRSTGGKQNRQIRNKFCGMHSCKAIAVRCRASCHTANVTWRYHAQWRSQPLKQVLDHSVDCVVYSDVSISVE